MRFNKFTGLPFIPYRIVEALTENENLFKLLKYNSYDCLSAENLTLDETLAMVWKDQPNMEDYNISRAMFSSDEDFNKALKEMVDVHIYVKKTNSLFLIKRADLLNAYNNDNYDTWENRVPDGVEEVKPSLIPLHL